MTRVYSLVCKRKVLLSVLMSSVICAHFNQLGDHVCNIGIRPLANETRAARVTLALRGWARKCIEQRGRKHKEDVVAVRIHLWASQGNNQGLGCSCCLLEACGPRNRSGPNSGQAYHHVPNLLHLMTLLNIPMSIC